MGDLRYDSTVYQPEIVIAELGGMQIKVEGISRRYSGAKYAVRPINTCSYVIECQTHEESLMTLDVNQRQDHEHNPYN